MLGSFSWSPPNTFETPITIPQGGWLFDTEEVFRSGAMMKLQFAKLSWVRFWLISIQHVVFYFIWMRFFDPLFATGSNLDLTKGRFFQLQRIAYKRTIWETNRNSVLHPFAIWFLQAINKQGNMCMYTDKGGWVSLDVPMAKLQDLFRA